MFNRGGKSRYLLFIHDLSPVGYPQKQILRWRLVCRKCVRSGLGIYPRGWNGVIRRIGLRKKLGYDVISDSASANP